MAKRTYTNIYELENDIKNDIKTALNDSMGEKIVDMLIKNAEEVVYSKYNPHEYDHEIGDRRYSLKDIGNYNIQVDDNMNLSVTPVAEFNPLVWRFYKKGNDVEWYSVPSKNSGNELAGLINYGNGWNGYEYDFVEDKENGAKTYSAPRPFIDITKEELNGGMAKKILSNSLKKMGYTVV